MVEISGDEAVLTLRSQTHELGVTAVGKAALAAMREEAAQPVLSRFLEAHGARRGELSTREGGQWTMKGPGFVAPDALHAALRNAGLLPPL